MEGFPDTHRLITGLKDRGFTDDQAEGVIEVVTQLALEHLATKQDLQFELKLQENRQLKFLLPVLLAQIAVFAAIVQWMLK